MGNGLAQQLAELWAWIRANLNEIDVLLSLIGFGFTWWQLLRTRRSAEAARTAATHAVAAVAHFDTVADIASAQAGLREIQVALRGQRYETALLRAQTIRELLHRLRSRPGFEDEARQVSIQSMVMSLRKLQDAMEQRLAEPEKAFSARVTNKGLADSAVELGSWA